MNRDFSVTKRLPISVAYVKSSRDGEPIFKMSRANGLEASRAILHAFEPPDDVDGAI